MARQRVALVTGSSRGLGAVIVRRLARDGFAVVVNGPPGDERVSAVAGAIRADGGTAAGLCADVTDETQVNGLVDVIADRFGPVDVLVVNATGPQPDGAVAEVRWEDHLAQLMFFVKSPVLLGKSAQIGLARSWAVDLAASGITVNTVAPGFIPVERHACVPEHVKTAYLASVPTGRMGVPEDIAAAVSFLASQDAGFITGQRLVVDGGRALAG